MGQALILFAIQGCGDAWKKTGWAHRGAMDSRSKGVLHFV